MTDEELSAIEAKAKDQDRLGSTAQPATVLALVAEVRRLRAEADDCRRSLGDVRRVLGMHPDWPDSAERTWQKWEGA